MESHEIPNYWIPLRPTKQLRWQPTPQPTRPQQPHRQLPATPQPPATAAIPNNTRQRLANRGSPQQPRHHPPAPDSSRRYLLIFQAFGNLETSATLNLKQLYVVWFLIYGGWDAYWHVRNATHYYCRHPNIVDGWHRSLRRFDNLLKLKRFENPKTIKRKTLNAITIFIICIFNK